MILPPGQERGEGSSTPWNIQKLYPNSTIWVLGAGPSLGLVKKYEDIIRNKITIAVNNAFQIGDYLSVCFFGDARHYWEYQKQMDEFKGLKVSFNIHITNNNPRLPINHIKDIKIINRVGKFGLSDNSKGINYNGSSGGAAINLAYRLGSNKIILVGMDLKLKDGKLHYFYNHHDRSSYLDKLKKKVIWEAIMRDAKEKGISIVNVSDNSDVPIIPKMKIEDVLLW